MSESGYQCAQRYQKQINLSMHSNRQISLSMQSWSMRGNWQISLYMRPTLSEANPEVSSSVPCVIHFWNISRESRVLARTRKYLMPRLLASPRKLCFLCSVRRMLPSGTDFGGWVLHLSWPRIHPCVRVCPSGVLSQVALYPRPF